MVVDAWIDELAGVVGRSHLLVDADLRAGYETDWTGRYVGLATAVVRPADTADVSRVLRICHREGVAVIAQGGNTGLVGGGVPRSAQRDQPVIVLSLQRLQQLGPVDAAAMQVTVGAGVTLAAWRAHARTAGLDTPVDFAARDSATIGGAIATNAGGSRVLRFGTMRRQVIGVEAVCSDGSIIGSLSGLPKEAAGLHWPSLLSGSEGTLAVITAARLQLVPWFRNTTTALVAVESLDAATRLLAELRRAVPSLDAVELIGPAALALVSTHLRELPPATGTPPGVHLMIDCAAHVDPTDDLSAVLDRAEGVLDTALATESAPRARLVAFRDRITEAIATASTKIGTPTFKLDVAVPLDALQRLVDVAQHAADADRCELVFFGHLAEGNLHLNYLGAHDSERIADTVLTAVAKMGGTISAEHGIGVGKARWLHLIRTPTELAAQAAVRAALDPAHLLNPGALEHPEAPEP